MRGTAAEGSGLRAAVIHLKRQSLGLERADIHRAADAGQAQASAFPAAGDARARAALTRDVAAAGGAAHCVAIRTKCST
jgi:hypothetical protein